MDKEYPKYQFTYMKGDFNICFRGNENWRQIFTELKEATNELENWVGVAGTPSGQKPTLATNGEEVQSCPECGEEMIFKSGKSKSGKQYAGLFCQNKNCKNVIWK